MMFYYYQIKNKQTDEKYIGITERPDKRFKEHLQLLKNKKHYNYKLQKAFDYFGEDNFIFEIIETKDFINRDLGYQYETLLIKNYDTVKNGYNIINEEQSNPIFTKSVYNKMVNSKQSVVPNVVQLEEIEENIFKIIKIYNSQKQAAKENNFSQANISKAIKTHVKASGYYWLNETDIPNFEIGWKPKRAFFNPVAEVNGNGKILNVHFNRAVFERELKLPKTSVTQSIRTGWSAKGHYFKNISDSLYYELKPITLIK